ncbi:MAG: hypothetical protein AAGJ82_04985 [Bacteroidota bacterium]
MSSLFVPNHKKSKANYCLLLLILLLSINYVPLLAQSKKDLKEQAKAYLAAGHYEDVIRTLQSSRSLLKTDEESKFLLAVCQYQTNQLATAKAGLERLVNEEKSPYPECWWYLGKIYHAQQQFAEATENYKLYLRTLPANSINRAMVIETIRRCDNGLRLLYGEAAAVVENAGPNINTAADEFGPVLSPNRATQFYFSAIREGNSGGRRGKHNQADAQFGQARSDMFVTRLKGGQWQTAEPLHPLLNSPQHEYLLGFADQGNVLLYYQGWNWQVGVLFADTFQQAQQRNLTTTPFTGPNRPEVGEQECFLYQDTLLIFAARRPGGFGGLDLYRSALRNGLWTRPENLGPEINTAFDETTPFLALNGKTLYYSTNSSAHSVGGLDVVRSDYLPAAQRWSEPRNLGLPINSPADDSHFRLSRDGFSGLLASARKDGQGQRDIYLVYFNKYRQEMEPPTPEIDKPVGGNQPVKVDQTVGVNQRVDPPPPPPPPGPQPTYRTSAKSLAELTATDWLRDLQATQLPSGATLVLSLYIPANTPSLTAAFFTAWEQLDGYAQRLQWAGLRPDQLFLRVLTHPESDYQLLATTTKPSSDGLTVLGAETQLQAIDKPLCYKVQVVSVQRSYENADLDKRSGLMLEQAGGSPYLRYTLGAVASHEEAQQLRRQILAAGYDGAYIVPYVHGVRQDKDGAREWSATYPNLRKYLGI